MKLEKDERYIWYCVMLQEFEERNYEFFCNCFKRLTDIDFSWDDLLFAETLPELWDKKPKHNLISNVWYYGSARDKRISLLKKCIQETHPDL